MTKYLLIAILILFVLLIIFGLIIKYLNYKSNNLSLQNEEYRKQLESQVMENIENAKIRKETQENSKKIHSGSLSANITAASKFLHDNANSEQKSKS